MQRTLVKIVVLLACLGIIVAQEKYLSCSRVREYCDSDGVTLPSSAINAGGLARRGKAGPKGAKGEPGPPGISAEIDMEALEFSILRKVKDWISKCQFVYNDSCFLVVGSFGGRYSKDDFERECATHGATLANLYGEDHRKKLTRFILKEIGNVYKELALGMTFNPLTSQFTSVQGEEISMTVTWHSTYPKTDQSFSDLFMSVNPDSSSQTMGAYNYKPQYLEFGVCEFQIRM